MTSSVGDKVNFALNWPFCPSTRSSQIGGIQSMDFSPKYADKTTTALLLPLHCPEALFLKEFMLQPLGSFDGNLTFVIVELHVGTNTIVSHKILKTDGDRNDPKVFNLFGPQFLAPVTARIWVRLRSSFGPNSNDSNTYQCTLWGQWVR